MKTQYPSKDIDEHPEILSESLKNKIKHIHSIKEVDDALLQELRLRGIILEDPQYPDLGYVPTRFLHYHQESCSEMIDLDKYGLHEFKEIFHINHPSFFHYVPLQGFLTLKRGIDLKELSLDFIEHGYSIHHKNGDVDLYHVYHQNSFVLFREYCKKHHLIMMNELSEDLFHSLKDEKGFGKTKIIALLNVYKQYKKYGYINDEYASTKLPETFENSFIPLNYIFDQSNYHLFIEYLKEKEKYFLSDLTYQDVLEFEKRSGVGDKKKIGVRKRLHAAYQKFHHYDPIFTLHRYEKLFELNITLQEVLDIFGIDHQVKENCFLKELNNKYYSQICHYFDLETFYTLLHYFESYTSLKDIFHTSYFDLSLKNEDREIFYRRVVRNEKLAFIADTYEVSRERIRQIVSSFGSKFYEILNNRKFFAYLHLYFYKQDFFFEKSLFELFGSEYVYLTYIIQNFNTPIHYLYEYHVYSNKWVSLPHLPIFDEDDYCLKNDAINIARTIWKNKVNMIHDHELLKMIHANTNYVDYHQLIAKTSLSKVKIVEAVFKYYIKDSLRIDEKGSQLIKDYCDKYFHYNIYEDSLHTLEAKARLSQSLLLVGPLEFAYFKENESILVLMKEIEKYLDTYFIDRNEINSKLLFLQFEDECLKLNIKNDTMLYALLKRYSHYLFSTGNEKSIYKDEQSRMSRIHQIETLFDKETIYLTKEYIITKLNWTLVKLENILCTTDTFYSNTGNKVYLAKHVHLNKQVIKRLRELMKQVKTHDYCFCHQLYEVIKKDSLLIPLLNTYHVESGVDLVAFQEAFNDWRFSYTIMFEKTSEKQTLIDIIQEVYPDIVSREELIQYLKDHYFEERSIMNYISSFLNKGYYIPLDKKIYINKDSFHLSKTDKNKIVQLFSNHAYYILNKIEDYHLFPKIDYTYTPDLLKYILLQSGFRKIERENKDYRYDSQIIVREESDIYTLADFIYFYLKTHYTGKMEVNEIENYLKEEKIIVKKIPQEIYQDKRFIIDDKYVQLL